MPQQFLIIQTAFIGDVVLATGLIEKLHHHYPEAVIDFMVRRGNEDLVMNHPHLRNVIVWDKKKNKLKNLWKILKQARKTRYDKLINIQRFAATGILTAFSGATETIGFDKNPLSSLFTKKIKHVVSVQGRARHEIERNNDLVAYFTDETAFRPKLYPANNDLDRVSGYKSLPYLTISPASVWFTKQYPGEKWISFIKQIPDHYNIYLLGGPGDQSLAEEIRKSSDSSRVANLCGQLNFLQSAALMKDAFMNYVNDSAPMHFASAMNAPVTAVYCSTLPLFGFGPLSDKSFIVEIPEPLYCRPCGLHGRSSCPESHFFCAYKISDGQLLETIR
ncbi:MAG: glycosyltransferase family 9 protein [Chitinophagaceae bacterium]|nr:glycosyltransferase family 9 protein [Chitinophagaceae bacterium]